MAIFDENRNFYRMLLNSEVVVTVIDDEANSQIFATCRDLSATGMGIELSHPIQVGTKVRAKIASASNSIPSLEVSGKVVRVTEENTACFMVAIAIEEID